jgi:hypothetical protein
MEISVDSIPGYNDKKYTDGSQRKQLSMPLGYFHQRRLHRNQTRVIDYIYYTENQYLAKNYRLFMKQHKPTMTADEIVNHIYYQRVEKKVDKLKLTPFQKYEAEKAKMLRHRKEKEMRRTSPVRITLEASRSCVTEPSILRTSTTISPNKKKKSFALPNIVKSYTISSTNNNVFKTIQQSSRHEKKINLFLTNLKY